MRVFRPTFEVVIRLYVHPQKWRSICLHNIIKFNCLQYISWKELNFYMVEYEQKRLQWRAAYWEYCEHHELFDNGKTIAEFRVCASSGRDEQLSGSGWCDCCGRQEDFEYGLEQREKPYYSIQI